LPTFDDSIRFRVYYRYSNHSDLTLVDFDTIAERYESTDYKYVVGTLSLHSLLMVQEELRRRKIFVAAYPND
jgi:homoserine dehydrogenase